MHNYASKSHFDCTVEQFSVRRLASLATEGHELFSQLTVNLPRVIISTARQVHKAGKMSKRASWWQFEREGFGEKLLDVVRWKISKLKTLRTRIMAQVANKSSGITRHERSPQTFEESTDRRANKEMNSNMA